MAFANISGIHTILSLHKGYNLALENQAPLIQSTMELDSHFLTLWLQWKERGLKKEKIQINKKEIDKLKLAFQEWKINAGLLVRKSREFVLLDDIDQKGKEFFALLERFTSFSRDSGFIIKKIITKLSTLRQSLHQFMEFEKKLFRERIPHAGKAALWAIIVHSASVVGALILAVVLGFFMASHLAEPVQKLTQEVKKVEEGSWDVELPIHQKDEIGELAKAFQSMLDSLSKTTVSINYLTKILDSMPNLLILIDEEGHILRINLAGRKCLGIREENERELKVSQLFPHFPSLPWLMKKSPFEWKLTSVDGREMVLLFSIAKLVFQNHEEYLLLGQDITSKKELEKELLETSEREQRRMGQDLHDGLGQILTGLSLLVKKVEKDLENHPARNQIQEIQHFLQQAIQECRALAKNQYPGEIEKAEFSLLMQQLKERGEELFNVAIHLDIQCEPPILTPFELMHLYRIIQEGIHNAVKHGEARKVDIRLYQNQEGLYFLEIEDNGKGFQNLENPEGMGIKIMEYRSHSIGASLELTGLPGKGTKILIHLGHRKGKKES